LKNKKTVQGGSAISLDRERCQGGGRSEEKQTDSRVGQNKPKKSEKDIQSAQGMVSGKKSGRAKKRALVKKKKRWSGGEDENGDGVSFNSRAKEAGSGKHEQFPWNFWGRSFCGADNQHQDNNGEGGKGDSFDSREKK